MQPQTVRTPRTWPFDPVRESAGDRAALLTADPDRRPSEPADPDGTHPFGAHPDGTRPADTDALVARLRSRRSAAGVAAAYAAAHGHPVDPRSEQGARRWALRGTTAAVAAVAVLLLGLGATVLLLREDDVVPLAPAAADGAAPGATPSAGSAFPGEGPAPGEETGQDGGHGAEGAGLLVHVVGAVREPGLVTVPDGARVADALEAAGGVTGRADLTAVNLARAVVDGEQLYVPRPGEAVPALPGAVTDGAGTGSGTGGTVDINTAD